MKELTGDQVEFICLKVQEYIDRHEPLSEESVWQRDSCNEDAVRLVADIIGFVKPEYPEDDFE